MPLSVNFGWCGEYLKNDSARHLDLFVGLVARVYSHRIEVVWFACIWSISKARNGKLFNRRRLRAVLAREVQHWWKCCKISETFNVDETKW